MVKYKKSYLKQRRFGAGERFETLETTVYQAEYSLEHVENATSEETLKWFRKRGSKQQVKHEWKNGVEIIKVFSYSPVNPNERNVLIFESIKE